MKNFKNKKQKVINLKESAKKNPERHFDSSTIVVGKNAIIEIVKRDPERILEFLLSDQNRNAKQLVIELFRERNLTIPRISYCTEDHLRELANGSNHQGVVAKVSPKPTLLLNDVLGELGSKKQSIVLFLDSVQDPQNFGAILRASECFGIDLVAYSKNRGVGVTPTVSKVSARASELVNILEVSNLANTIEKFKSIGYWVVAADVNPNSKSLFEFKFPEKTLIIMGAEGKGIQQLLLKISDFRVFIPMKGSIDSLNVSQATAVMLSWCARPL